MNNKIRPKLAKNELPAKSIERSVTGEFKRRHCEELLWLCCDPASAYKPGQKYLELWPGSSTQVYCDGGWVFLDIEISKCEWYGNWSTGNGRLAQSQ